MTVRDDRGDVKQTTTGFRGPLMVQSLTSAKSKFLSLICAVSLPLLFLLAFAEALARIVGVSDYLEVKRSTSCEPVDKIRNECLRRYKPFSEKKYIKGVVPPYELQAIKRTNDIGILSDYDFSLLKNPDNNYRRVVVIGDSLAEGKQVNNSSTFHNLLWGKQLSADPISSKLVRSASLAVLGTSFPDYIGEFIFASQHIRAFEEVAIIFLISPTDYVQDDNVKSHFYFSNNELRHRSNEKAGNSWMRALLAKSALARYIFINLEAHALIRNVSRDSGAAIDFNSRLSKNIDRNKLFLDLLVKYAPKSYPKRSILMATTTTFAKDLVAKKSFEDLRKRAVLRGFSVIDLSQDLNSKVYGGYAGLRFRNDGHWNHKGHSVVANALISKLRDIEAIQSFINH